MVAGITNTASLSGGAGGALHSDLKAALENLRTSIKADEPVRYGKYLQTIEQEAAAEIPDSNDVPSDITDLLRQLDVLGRQIGNDNNPNVVRYNKSGAPDKSPVAPKFQNTLAQILSKVQAFTAGKSDAAKSAIGTYISQALTTIDNYFREQQHETSDALSNTDPRLGQLILPNGKGQGTDYFDEIQVQRDNIKNALNSLFGPQGDRAQTFSNRGTGLLVNVKA